MNYGERYGEYRSFTARALHSTCYRRTQSRRQRRDHSSAAASIHEFHNSTRVCFRARNCDIIFIWISSLAYVGTRSISRHFVIHYFLRKHFDDAVDYCTPTKSQKLAKKTGSITTSWTPKSWKNKLRTTSLFLYVLSYKHTFVCSDRNLRQHTKRNGNLFGVSFKFVEELFRKDAESGSYTGRGNVVYMFELPVEVCLQERLSKLRWHISHFVSHPTFVTTRRIYRQLRTHMNVLVSGMQEGAVIRRQERQTRVCQTQVIG